MLMWVCDSLVAHFLELCNSGLATFSWYLALYSYVWILVFCVRFRTVSHYVIILRVINEHVINIKNECQSWIPHTKINTHTYFQSIWTNLALRVSSRFSGLWQKQTSILNSDSNINFHTYFHAIWNILNYLTFFYCLRTTEPSLCSDIVSLRSHFNFFEIFIF